MQEGLPQGMTWSTYTSALLLHCGYVRVGENDSRMDFFRLFYGFVSFKSGSRTAILITFHNKNDLMLKKVLAFFIRAQHTRCIMMMKYSWLEETLTFMAWLHWCRRVPLANAMHADTGSETGSQHVRRSACTHGHVYISIAAVQRAHQKFGTLRTAPHPHRTSLAPSPNKNKHMFSEWRRMGYYCSVSTSMNRGLRYSRGTSLQYVFRSRETTVMSRALGILGGIIGFEF